MDVRRWRWEDSPPKWEKEELIKYWVGTKGHRAVVEFVATKYRGGEIRWVGTEVALRLDCSGIVWSLNNHGLSDRLILNRILVSVGLGSWLILWFEV
jgi:hypothetical protein